MSSTADARTGTPGRRRSRPCRSGTPAGGSRSPSSPCSVAMAVNSVLTNPNWAWEFQCGRTRSPSRCCTASGQRSGSPWPRCHGRASSASSSPSCACRPTPSCPAAPWFYIWLFRGTPVLVAARHLGEPRRRCYRQISLGIPFGPEWFTIDTRNLDPELRRRAARPRPQRGRVHGRDRPRRHPVGGRGPDRGGVGARACPGMQTMRRIVLPQAMRVDRPADRQRDDLDAQDDVARQRRALRGAVLPDARPIGSRTFQPFPMLIVASLWYLAMTSVLMVGQYYIERHYARGSVPRPAADAAPAAAGPAREER